VDLCSAWYAGCNAAIQVLEASQLPRESFDYTNLFMGTVDTLRPWGGNSYPGVSTDVDCSLSIEEGDDADLSRDNPNAAVTALPQANDVHTTAAAGDTSHIMPVHLTASPVEMLATVKNDNFCLWEESLANVPKLVDPDPLNDPTAAPAHLLAQPEDYLEHEGHMIHKQTFCHLFLSRDSPHFSYDRLSRW
jgi:hypothetical protein